MIEEIENLFDKIAETEHAMVYFFLGSVLLAIALFISFDEEFSLEHFLTYAFGVCVMASFLFAVYAYVLKFIFTENLDKLNISNAMLGLIFASLSYAVFTIVNLFQPIFFDGDNLTYHSIFSPGYILQITTDNIYYQSLLQSLDFVDLTEMSISTWFFSHVGKIDFIKVFLVTFAFSFTLYLTMNFLTL